MNEGPTPEGTYRERSVHRGYEASNAIDVRIADPSAAEDARRRAEAFADALGLRLGSVRSIDESASGPWERGGGRMLSGAATVGVQELGIEANLEITASVSVTYAIE